MVVRRKRRNSGFRAHWLGLSLIACSIPFALPGQTGVAHAASFDCNAQTLQPDEKVICDNRTLNDADVKMVTTFDLLSGLLAMGSRGALQDAQSAWLKKRQACGADAARLK